MSSEPDKPDLVWRRHQAEAFLTLSRMRQVMERHIETGLTEQELTEITPAQANALMVVIQAREPIRAKRMASDLGVSEPTVHRFIKALEQNGWLARERDPEDSRSFLLLPTQKARDALPRFIRVFNGLLDQMFTGFSKEEMITLGQAIHRMFANLEDSR